MSQNDLTIANQGFASFRTDLNSALQALGSTNSGTSAPSTTFANQLFYDTTNNILKIRNEDNDAFISLFTLDQSNDNIESLTINGAFACEGFTSSGIDDNADAVALTIDNGENVAIGVTSKNSANNGSLTIGHTGMTKITGTANGNADELVLIGANASANVGMSIISNNANQGIIYFGDEDDTDIAGFIYDHSSNFLAINTNAGERVRITSSGNLGIGETSPQRALHVNGIAKFMRTVTLGGSTGSNNYIGYFTAEAFGNNADESHVTVGTFSTQPLIFATHGYERARFLAPSTSHSGFFKISDSGSYQSSTGGFHEIRSSSSNQAGVAIGASHASFSANVISIITQRANSSSFRYIQGLSSNTGDTDYSVRGDGEVFADGSFNSGGADYAEMFEWKDGNTSTEDRVGKTVVLDGNQVRLSTSDDAQATIIGVVSARPVVLGDAQNDKWKDKYETDDYGRYVFEDYTQTEWTTENSDGDEEFKSYQTDMIPSDVTVPDDAIVTSKDENGDNLKRRKLNSAFDASKTYIPREDRKEFSAIGLVGKLRVNVGQTVGDRWIKMREISNTVHEYLVR